MLSRHKRKEAFQMNEAKDILPLIGLLSEDIGSFEATYDEDYVFMEVQLVDRRKPCPYCKSNNIIIKENYSKTLNNSIIKHKCISIRLNYKRLICKDCKKSFFYDYKFSEEKARISNATKLAILDDLKEPLTYSQIAKDHNVSVNTVIGVFKTILYQKRLNLSEIICIDEFCFKHKGHTGIGKYPAVITNPLKPEIIDIVESRWKDVLFDYFNKVNYYERKAVKYFVSDMNETYRQLKKAFFHDALHVADRFHVIKAFNESITSIRTRIIKDELIRDKDYGYLKKNWKIFLMNRDELLKRRVTDEYGIISDPSVKLDACLRRYPQLQYAYTTKDEFVKAIKRPLLYKEAEDLLNFNIRKLENSLIKEMNKLGRTLRNWKIEIINGLTKNPYGIRISNGIAECMNNKIQTLIDSSYGLKSFELMRKRVLYIDRNKKKK